MRKLSFLLILFLTINSFAQVKVRTWLEHDTVRFAQPTLLNVEVITPKTQVVLFPQLSDTLQKDLEVDTITVDTTEKEANRKLIYHIQIFPFKDTVFHIRSITFQVGGNIYNTDSVVLVVLPMEIDSVQVAKIDTSQVIDVFDVKPPINPKLTLRELWLRFRYWLLGALLLALLGYLLYWLYRKYRSWKEVKDLPEELQLAPHELAMKRLKELEESRLYQQGEFKEFYAILSEIVRQYIERRFHIRALEATTTELKLLLQASPDISSEWREKLIELFETADLAKFASYKPYPHLAAKHLSMAYDFVEATMPREEENSNEDIVNQENTEQ